MSFSRAPKWRLGAASFEEENDKIDELCDNRIVEKK